MEIDFLGLHSSRYTTATVSMDHPSITPTSLFSDKESGVETSLSLGTTTYFDSHTNILSSSKQKKKKTTTTKRNSGYYKKEEGSQVIAAFLYDLNGTPNGVLRDAVSNVPSSEACRGGCPNGYTDALPDKDDNAIHGLSRESTTSMMIGYRPTVAMARRATLARFLEKRLHRLNQSRTSHLIMGKPHMIPNNSEGC